MKENENENPFPLTHEKLTQDFWQLYPTWDNSMRSMGNQCPRKLYWWLRGYSWQSDSKPIYFLFGSAWHEIKQYYYASFGITPEQDPVVRAIEAFEAGKKYWDENEVIRDLETPTHPVDNINNLKNLWAVFIAHNGEEPPPFSVIGTPELGWIWNIAQSFLPEQLYLGGAVDDFIRHRNFGSIVLEEKTTSAYLTDAYMRQWEFASQLTGYAWMLSQFGHEPTILLQAAHKRILKGTGSTPQFASCLVEKTREQLEVFEDDWRAFLQTMEQNRSNEIWSMSGTTDPRQCVGGLGFSPCPYRGLCASGQQFSKCKPINFVGIGVREPWTPWKRAGEQDGGTKGKNIAGTKIFSNTSAKSITNI